jgi:hypothetical protein
VKKLTTLHAGLHVHSGIPIHKVDCKTLSFRFLLPDEPLLLATLVRGLHLSLVVTCFNALMLKFLNFIPVAAFHKKPTMRESSTRTPENSPR